MSRCSSTSLSLLLNQATDCELLATVLFVDIWSISTKIQLKIEYVESKSFSIELDVGDWLS